MPEETHSILSPSGANGWMSCYAQPFMCKDKEQETSTFAAEGTLAHKLAERCLCSDEDVLEYTSVQLEEDGPELEIPEDMYEPVQKYIDTVRAMTEQAGLISYECKLDTSKVVGVANHGGTADVCAIIPLEEGAELQVHDLKYGKGIRVSAVENKQLMIYALAALEEYKILYSGLNNVRLVIHQPRLGVVSEWECSITDLEAFGEEVKKAAKECMAIYNSEREATDADYAPSESACRWCLAKADCKALAKHIEDGVKGDFDKIEDVPDKLVEMENEELAKRLPMIDLLKMYTKALEATALARAMRGEKIPGFKVVEGRKGNRAWESEAAAEKLLKSMRLKKAVMYREALQTPTAIVKVLKNQPRRLKRVEEVIVRRDAVKHVVPVGDDRPEVEIASVREDFKKEE